MFQGEGEGMRGALGSGGKSRIDLLIMRILVRMGLFP